MPICVNQGNCRTVLGPRGPPRTLELGQAISRWGSLQEREWGRRGRDLQFGDRRRKAEHVLSWGESPARCRDHLLKTLASGTCLHDSSPIHLPRQWDSGFLLLTSMPFRAISSAKVISFLPARHPAKKTLPGSLPCSPISETHTQPSGPQGLCQELSPKLGTSESLAVKERLLGEPRGTFSGPGPGEVSEGSPNTPTLSLLQRRNVVDFSVKTSLFRFPDQKAPHVELIPRSDIGLVPARIGNFAEYPLGTTVSITGLISPHEHQPREAAWAGSPELQMLNVHLPVTTWVSFVRQAPLLLWASVFPSAKRAGKPGTQSLFQRTGTFHDIL